MNNLTFEDYYQGNRPFFVYGTLRPGGSNFGRFGNAKFTNVSRASVTGYDMFAFHGFPFIIPGEGTVQGSLISVTDDSYESVLTALDSLEGFITPNSSFNFYERKLVTVTADGVDVDAWVYEYNDVPHARENTYVPSGDWFIYKQALLSLV